MCYNSSSEQGGAGDKTQCVTTLQVSRGGWEQDSVCYSSSSEQGGAGDKTQCVTALQVSGRGLGTRLSVLQLFK